MSFINFFPCRFNIKFSYSKSFKKLFPIINPVNVFCYIFFYCSLSNIYK